MMRKPVTGSSGMIGRLAVARSALGPEGQVQLDGEIWRAVSDGGAIAAGEQGRVMAVGGLTLQVGRAADRSLPARRRLAMHLEWTTGPVPLTRVGLMLLVAC